MTLNFPANPSTQNPSNTFSPTSTPFASTNGATYIYQDGGWISLRNPIGNPEIQLSPTASAGDRPLLLKTTANDSSETTETLPYSSGLTFDASTAKLDVEGTIQSSGGVLIDGPASGAGLTMNQSGGSRITMNAAGRKYFIASDDGSDRLNIGARISNDTADKTNIRLTSSNTTIYDVLYVEAADNPLIRFVDTGTYQYQVGIANNNQFVISKGGNQDVILNYNTSGNLFTFSANLDVTGTATASSFDGNLIKSSGNQTIGSTSGGTVNVYSSTSHALRMYKEGTTNIYGAFKITSLTANHAYTLPDKNGTVAMTSDIPSTSGFVTTTGAQTISGEKTFTNQVDIENNLIVGSGTGTEGGQLTLRPNNGDGTQVFLDVDASNDCRLASTQSNCSFTIGQIAGTGGTMNLYAGGYRRLIILSNGNVGIGTDTPSTPLHVKSDNGNTSWFSSTSTRSLLRFGTSDAGNLYIGADGTNNFVVRNKPGSGSVSEKFRVTGNGKVGIGTDDPQAKLDVVGTATATTFDGDLIKSSGNQTIGSTSGGTVNVYSSTSHALRMYKEGTTNIYGAFKITSLTANHAYTLPDKNGTVAMTSDIPSLTNYVTTNTTQTISGSKTFTSQVDVLSNIIVGSGTGTEGGQLTLRPNNGTGTQVFLDVDSNNGCRLASTQSNCSFTIGQIGGTGGNMNLYAGGSRRLVILASNGKVGINNASPTKTLDVGGDFALTGGSDFGGNLNCSARVQAAYMQLKPGTSSPADSLVRISGNIGGNYTGFYGFDYAPTKVNKPTASGSQLVVGSRVTFSNVTTLNSANKLHAFEAVGLTNTLTSGPNVDEVVGFYSNVPATKPTNAGGASYEAYNIFVAGSAPSQIPSVNALHVKLQQPSDLNQYDSEGNPLSYSQTDAATIDTGLYRDANDNICFARNGTEVMKLGAGTGVGNLIEKINNLTSALTLLKAAANDSNTDDAGKFAAIVAALTNF